MVLHGCRVEYEHYFWKRQQINVYKGWRQANLTATGTRSTKDDQCLFIDKVPRHAYIRKMSVH